MRNRLREETSRKDQVTYTVKADRKLAQIATTLIEEVGYRNFSEVVYDAIYRMVSAADPGLVLPTLERELSIQDERDRDLLRAAVALKESANTMLSQVHR